MVSAPDPETEPSISVDFTTGIVPGKTMEFNTVIGQLSDGVTKAIVSQKDYSSIERILAAEDVNYARPVELQAVPISSNDVTLKFIIERGGIFTVTDVAYNVYDSVLENYVVVECDTNNVLSDDYRFGFNGQHKDNEWKGMGNSIDYEKRMEDTRLGRFLSIDPITYKYPSLTPFQVASNSPISGVDQDGLEYIYYQYKTFQKEGKTYVSVHQTRKDISWFDKMQGNKPMYALSPEGSTAEPLIYSSHTEMFKAAMDFASGQKNFQKSSEANQQSFNLFLAVVGTEIAGKAFGLADNYVQSKIAKSYLNFTPIADEVAEDAFIAEQPSPQTTTPQSAKVSKKSPSVILAENMKAAGIARPANTAAHHIVAESDPRAQAARDVLDAHGIDINDADNGIFLPKNSNFANPPAITHTKIHTNTYYQNIVQRMLNTTSPRNELNKINTEINNGTFPYK